MSNEAMQSRWNAAVMDTYGTPPIALVSGRGATVTDADGKEYVDLLGGIAVNALGHAHPKIIEAVTQQVSTLGHVSNLYISEPVVRLAERLTEAVGVPGTRVFFSNSGAEANEAAIKIGRRTGRTAMVAAEGAFHGRTMGSLAMTAKESMRAPFEPMPGGVEHIPATIEALEAALDDRVAAVIVEPIQGEAGVIELPAGYLEAARSLTLAHGALLIIDEIQTGAGRTGEWFGFTHAGITPDAITLAKGIGGGFPIGALVTFGEAGLLFQPGSHGSTYGGNPLATAVADAVLAEIEHAGLVANAARRGEELREAVRGIDSPLLAEVRGQGLLIGVGLTAPVAGEIVAAAQQRGLIVNAASPSSVRLAPALTIGDAEIAEFLDLFTAALADVHASVSGKVPA